ncbi:MAG: CehA/McbA family metallohydrolase [Candidatus Omnitrophota bacterium]|nr:CehA/McbA family metallohydrolase [Candidatus Omnitrophota bacterium]
MNGLSLRQTIVKQAEGSYFTLAFDVPSQVCKLVVSYSYLKQSKRIRGNIVDLGLEDPDGNLVGWSGSDRRSVFAGEEESTPGYRIAPIAAGTWNIMVGAYLIREEGCLVEYQIRWELKADAWYRGDLHLHTTASDGHYTLPEIIRSAQRKHLDFIALSNHNNVAENAAIPPAHGLTVIPSVEWTHYQGHVNFFGLVAPFEKSFVAHTEAEAHAIMEHAERQGALISVNHPSCSHCPYRWDKNYFSYMEIWNGPMRRDNLNAIDWWKSRMREGKRFTLLGGSDFHRFGFVRLGHPVTAVLARSRSAADLLEGLKQGHAYVTGSVRGPVLGMECEGKTFGDTVVKDAETRLHITARNLCFFHVLRVQGKTGELMRLRPRWGTVDVWLPISEPGYVFLEVTMHLPFISPRFTSAISNPMYFD